MTVAVASIGKFEGGWLKSPSFDLTFIIGLMTLAVTSGAIILYNPNMLGIVIFLDMWFLGYHHVIATFTKLAGTREDRIENRFLIYHLPIIVLALVFLFGLTFGVWTIVTLYFFWQWYHYTRQSYGIYSFYRRKAEKPVQEDQRFTQAVLWSIPIWGVLNRCSQGWETFLSMPIWVPPVPQEIVWIAGLVSCTLVGLWCIKRFIAWRNESLPVAQTLFTLSHFAVFYVGYIAISDINIGWVVANIWHNAQYILFVWLYNTNRFRKNPVEQNKNIIVWACQEGAFRAVMYFTLCLILTSTFYGTMISGYEIFLGHNTEVFAAVYILTFQAVNFHHYVVDSIIWKARNKKNQAIMNLKNA